MVACLVLSGCGEHRPGESPARDLAAAEAEILKDDFGHRDRVRDAEYIAATEVPNHLDNSDSPIRRVLLGWSGRTVGGEQATIDVQFVVTLTDQQASSYGDHNNSAGQVKRCYRYFLELYRYTTYDEIECPSTATAPVPTASPFPDMPDDGRERLTAALRTATPDTLASRVRAAFPEKHVTVDTVTHQGALVAAVGVPAERDCIVLVRTPGGAIESPAYDRIWLEPGEMGCRTGLYVSPPR
ncbi:hypothetical protein AWW66_26135 [Micromonospora rosaria]|uniref:Uncharacterized protein n=1 Tax=Micromonospora rosaria TaxID=47874 RepID=A0A136PKZ6_9ACTN|nr:hypothetical protein AWW66_26135 [Micromonospora rosaria]